MKRFLKLLAYAASGIIILLLVLGVGGYFYFKSGLAKYQGTVQIAGIRNKVSITRDKNALPHIKAQTIQDAYFAMGYVHAQDRLWQMQLHRHIAMGRLSELVGKNGLETDKFLRNLGMLQAAKNSYHLLRQETKSQLEAYSSGVNAYLAEDNVLPIEFAILGLDKPKNWRPIESVAWMKIMAWDLNGTWNKELDRLIMSATFSANQIADFHPAYPGDEPFITPDPQALFGIKLKPVSEMQITEAETNLKLSNIITNQTIDGIGSNNWVLSGALSETSMPLLANDPHLQLTAPALWYHVHLKAQDGSINAIGATMPGVPYIILGRNDKIAWGFTNTDPDVQDLYVEKITKQGYYKTPTGEAAFITRDEVIKVKGSDDVKITVRATRHGPIISDELLDVQKMLGKDHVLALRWTALDNDSRTLDAASMLATSTDWLSFKNAVKHFKAPQQSLVYADIKGNIGFIAPGAVPIRHPKNELYGQYPSPGWLAKYDWQGYIPFDELPQKFNPSKGYIATANHKIIDEDYKYHIASKWTLPYRYNRIVELIEEKPIHSMQSMKTIQLDQYSLFLENMRILLGKNLIGAKVEDKSVRQAIQIIGEWDGIATAKSNEMLILTLWIKNLQTAILSSEFTDELARNDQFLENILMDVNGSSKWCGALSENNGTPLTCQNLILESLDKTVQQLANKFGSDMTKWQWSDTHKAVGAHRIFDKVAGLNWLFNIVTPVGGGKTTINVATYKTKAGNVYNKTSAKKVKEQNQKPPTDLTNLFRNTHGPSLRHLFDLSNLENSLYIHSSGQSGNIFSPHYDDYAARWAAGKYLPLTMKEENYKKDAIGELLLIPKS
ncbi:MAG: penicillin acylase family protein [Rhizobiales bacterium]|nr:penicillin acylase family protein [Hyphomicrobiales bacterium]